MNRATLVKKLDGERQILVRCEPPLEGHEFVVSSIALAFAGSETYLFPADEVGTITNWTELPGSQKGVTDHAKVLRDAGYDLVESL